MTETKPSQKRPTLADVASKAGVSVALASIVMRNAEGASEASRQKVKDAAAAMGYRPDSRARSLRSHRSRTLGLTLMLGEPLHAELADALYVEAENKSYELILGATSERRDEQRTMDTLIDAGVEGIIAVSSSLPPAAMAQLASQVPVVSLLRNYSGIPSVLTDEAAGIEQLVSHLASAGHTRLLHLNGGAAVAARQRAAAFNRAIEGSNGQLHGEQVLSGPCEQIAAQALGDYLEHCDPTQMPTAVLAFNDRSALGARQTLLSRGLRIPQDVALTGFDDSEFARLAFADLTTSRQDVNALAASAMGLATNPASKVRTVKHPPQLVVRSSAPGA